MGRKKQTNKQIMNYTQRNKTEVNHLSPTQLKIYGELLKI
jgi:hypothetical protein